MKLLHKLEFLFRADRFRIVAFYPYTSIVQDRIIEEDYGTDTIFIKFANDIKSMAKELGCQWDNKVVVEIQPTDKNSTKISSLFVGYKDCIICAGLSVYQPDSYTKKYNQTFNEVLEPKLN
jgi:hypothetical protein